MRYRGQSYSFHVHQLGPERYRATIDGAAVELEVERHGEHERRLALRDTSFRTAISRQGADLLVEVDGLPHRVSHDQGGAVRSPAPGVVVSVPVAVGEEVEAGDVVAVLESMKMENSLVAPQAGRVRKVMVGPNVQVDVGDPLVEVEPRKEEGAERASGERVEFAEDEQRASAAHERCMASLRLLASAVMGYDVPGGMVDEAIADLHSTSSDRRVPLRSDRRRGPALAPVRGPARAHPPPPRCGRPRAGAAAQPPGVLPLLPALARSGGARGCRSASARCCGGRSPITASRTWIAPPSSRTPATGCSSPSSGLGRSTRRCWRSSTGGWSRRASSRDGSPDDFSETLARLGAATEGRAPAIADLVRAGSLPLLRRAGDRRGARGRICGGRAAPGRTRLGARPPRPRGAHAGARRLPAGARQPALAQAALGGARPGSCAARGDGPPLLPHARALAPSPRPGQPISRSSAPATASREERSAWPPPSWSWASWMPR